MQDFWKDVETATNERQRSMFHCINQHLQTLSRQIEATVGRVLEVRLEPVTIAMDPPAAQDFHESLQNLFAMGKPAFSCIRQCIFLQKGAQAANLGNSCCPWSDLILLTCLLYLLCLNDDI